MLEKILLALVKGVGDVLLKFLNTIRRDKGLKDEGKNEVVVEYYKDLADKQKKVLEVQRPADGDGRRRMRERTF